MSPPPARTALISNILDPGWVLRLVAIIRSGFAFRPALTRDAVFVAIAHMLLTS